MTRKQEKIMNQAGFIFVTDAQKVCGFDSNSAIHKLVNSGNLIGEKAGHWLYISGDSLLRYYSTCPTIFNRIVALLKEKNVPFDKKIIATQLGGENPNVG